ncbi:MAG: stage II sporulation protein M, partial [Microbacteriaceae bacterium]
ARRKDWDRLDQLSKASNLNGSEADELIELYQRSAADLSEIKANEASSVLGDWLSLVLSRARITFTGTSRNLFSQLPEFFAAQLPAALYRVRWLSLAVTGVSILAALTCALWALSNPEVLNSFGDKAALEKLVNEDFVNYYSDNPAASFMGLVWTNNAWIAAQCVAFGIVGVWVPYVMLQNALNVGITGAIMFSYEKGDVFFQYILPHGMLELYAIFVAGGTGLFIFWSWIAPGHRSRAESLAEAARSAFTIVIGLVIALLISGIIEGFVTPQPWPWQLKIAIGAIAFLGFLLYQFWLGRRAWRAGFTGDLNRFDAGVSKIVAG